MPKIISIHQYILRPNADESQFEQSLQRARQAGLLALPGLLDFQFVQGIKGARKGQYAAIWIYESREAWEKLWGPPENPRKKRDYPESWKVWEDQVLAPFLEPDPDQIEYTVYEELSPSPQPTHQLYVRRVRKHVHGLHHL
ncbi:MAG: hypothetical protein ACE5HO_17860 [bacterium]